MTLTAEHERLLAYRRKEANWKGWGPYLAERAWGTVREDYSAHGGAWDYFPHDHARSRAYRWNEDGLAGISDRFQYLCLALALWNGRDPILKERLFGLSGPEGNHGEDVKECYFYVDNTPSHSYMRMLYKYPQQAFPYEQLMEENARRGPYDFEFELINSGVFDENRYFDVSVEYAKASPEDILAKISICNRGPDVAKCEVLPTLWYRNTWSWGYEAGPMQDVQEKPSMSQIEGPPGTLLLRADHWAQGSFYLFAEGAAEMLFTENETNNSRLFGGKNASPYVKDAFHRCIVDGQNSAVNPARVGTKAAARYTQAIEPAETYIIRLRLSKRLIEDPFADFTQAFERRRLEADEFYKAVQRPGLVDDERNIQRQALAGMLWSKQMYYYDVEQWLDGDPAGPPPPASRRSGRNHGWRHVNNFDILSMPDKWEYPWFAAWDLAFHCIPLVMVDADFAKRQLELMTREWYMHPNGQMPAYEWAFGDVNPPVHAWAAWRVYRIDAEQQGRPDTSFLRAVFHKLLLNFTWWVNRKDADGNNIFQGGFLGLDNISIFDRSATLPSGGHIDQSDGTAWMGFFSLLMMRISLELAKEDRVYEDMASKFYEHFLSIAMAMTGAVRQGHGLWDEEDGFFYDVLHMPDGAIVPLKVRSLVGLMPLLAVESITEDELQEMQDFERRMRWFTQFKPHLSGNMASIEIHGEGHRHLASVLTPERLASVLRYMLDEDEFLSEYGIRSLSKIHREQPFSLSFGATTFSIDYQPAESRSGVFGGNSNWRGPIWFPINFLIIESLRKFHQYYGDSLRVEYPTRSGEWLNLGQVAERLSGRLIRLFARDLDGQRPAYGGQKKFQEDTAWRDLILFYEYYHGDNGAGLGASHQTGWTGLVANLIQQFGSVNR